jgi:hypothetical protein
MNKNVKIEKLTVAKKITKKNQPRYLQKTVKVVVTQKKNSFRLLAEKQAIKML